MNFDHPLWSRSWQRAWRALALPGDGVVLRDELLGAYARPERHYHTQQHLAECLALFDEYAALASDPGAVEVALWFHDAIYQPSRSDNEVLSASWARAALGEVGAPSEQLDTIEALILATVHTAMPPGPDPQLLVDIDLSILGASPQRFAEYDAQIRREYAFVPTVVYRQKRRSVLRSFLNRASIYRTEPFRDRFEKQARDNLYAAIAPG